MSEPIFLSDDVPFTLSCYECDCESPHCYDEAVNAGWTLIQFTPEGLGENYLGLCPECGEKWNAPGGSASVDSKFPCSGECNHVQDDRKEPPRT